MPLIKTAYTGTPVHRVGDLRPSQVLFAYGIGSTVDLPMLSVLVLGQDFWRVVEMRELVESRLLRAVQHLIGEQVASIRLPPMPEEAGGFMDPLSPAARVGVPVVAFPRWHRCPACDLLAPLETGLFKLKANAYHPDRTGYVHEGCARRKQPFALPVRFLVACDRGHLDDFPWVQFAHLDRPLCSSAMLRLAELGVSGTANDVLVACNTCGARQPMSRAFGEEGKQLMPGCTARRPHLRDVDPDGCKEQMTTILASASNSWFPVAIGTLAIPEGESELAQLVEAKWDVLGKAASREMLDGFLLVVEKLRELSAYSAEQIWEAVQQRNSGEAVAPDSGDLKTPEWNALTSGDPRLNSPDFQLRPAAPPPGFEKQIESVVLVERLREVSAFIGFTRLSSPGDFADPEEIPVGTRAPLSRVPPQWVVGSETRGEGIFVKFHQSHLHEWSERPAVVKRLEEFRIAHEKWLTMRKHPHPTAGFPGAWFILIHSFAHALMRQLSLECGYTAAGLNERIYATDPTAVVGEPMAGVLIYTAANDSEGTMGGLVSQGKPETLARHIRQALEQVRLCASDPLCSEHAPHRETVTLHGAACHACLFAPETSCERGNRYLDRNLLVETLAAGGAFFGR